MTSQSRDYLSTIKISSPIYDHYYNPTSIYFNSSRIMATWYSKSRTVTLHGSRQNKPAETNWPASPITIKVFTMELIAVILTHNWVSRFYGFKPTYLAQHPFHTQSVSRLSPLRKLTQGQLSFVLTETPICSMIPYSSLLITWHD